MTRATGEVATTAGATDPGCRITVRVADDLRGLLAMAGPVVIDLAIQGRDRNAPLRNRMGDPAVAVYAATIAESVENDDPSAAITIQCAVLEHFGVRQGTKAIAVFMHRHWSAELVARHGPALNPNTLRRWRAAMSATPPRCA